MAIPALKLKFEEVTVEERLARIESNVENIQTNVAEMRVDIRRLNDKIDGVDQKLSAKIDGVDQKLSGKIDGVDQKQCSKFDSLKDAIAALQLSQEKAISKLTLWAVTLYIGLAVTLLTVIARSLHWP